VESGPRIEEDWGEICSRSGIRTVAYQTFMPLPSSGRRNWACSGRDMVRGQRGFPIRDGSVHPGRTLSNQMATRWRWGADDLTTARRPADPGQSGGLDCRAGDRPLPRGRALLGLGAFDMEATVRIQ